MSEIKEVSVSLQKYFSGKKKGKMYLEEAEFALRQILPAVEKLPPGSRILEIGSGPCIVLAELSKRFPNHKIQGVEPMSMGFAFFKDFVSEIQSTQPNLNVHLGGYEDYTSSHKWDYIFLVNVFEHLPNWEHFLDFIIENLSVNGVCEILCPNYGFPFESHFRIPVVINKNLTKLVFRNTIRKFELENDNSGLFESLNFVRLSKVSKELHTRKLEYFVDTSIINEIIERGQSDPNFQYRQRFMLGAARILDSLGLVQPLLKSRRLQNYLPYMHLTIKHRIEEQDR